MTAEKSTSGAVVNLQSPVQPFATFVASLPRWCEGVLDQGMHEPHARHRGVGMVPELLSDPGGAAVHPEFLDGPVDRLEDGFAADQVASLLCTDTNSAALLAESISNGAVITSFFLIGWAVDPSRRGTELVHIAVLVSPVLHGSTIPRELGHVG